MLINEENISVAFSILDADGDGTITVEELKLAFAGQRMLSDDSLWKEMVRAADTDGDGVISKAEFYEYMMGMLKLNYLGEGKVIRLAD